jgi:hypothetical protein
MRMKWATASLTALFLMGLIIGGATSAPAVRGSATNVLTIYQSTNITERSTFSVSMELSSSANIKQIYYTFCQLTSSVCYLPVVMAPVTGEPNWFEGTTNPMTAYPGMVAGVRAGYNITILFDDNSSVTEPALPNQFGNLTVAQSVTGEYMYEMTVHSEVYQLSGHVYDSATGVGIPGANVTLTPKPGNATATKTNATGAYSFAGLLVGNYTLSVTDGGYQTDNASVAITDQNAQKNITLSKAVSIPKGKTTNGTSGGFFGTMEGVSVLVIAAVAVIVVALVAVTVTRRKKEHPSPPSQSPPEPPQPPSQKPS